MGLFPNPVGNIQIFCICDTLKIAWASKSDDFLQMAGALAPKKKEGTGRKEFTHADDM